MEEEDYEAEFEERLAEDAIIYERMQYLQSLPIRTPEQQRELVDLHYRYYSENQDVRRHWKTL